MSAFASEAMGHVREVYDLLLRTDAEVKGGCHAFFPWGPEDSQLHERHVQRVMEVISVLKGVPYEDLVRTFTDWRSHAIAFLGKKPSDREKAALRDPMDRTLFLSCVLWYGGAAVGWLAHHVDSGRYLGISYRDMTMHAAHCGKPARAHSRTSLACLPLMPDVEDSFGSKREQERYVVWTFDMELEGHDELGW